MYKLADFAFTYPAGNHTITWRGIHRIGSGERILLSGTSGSGKSTLLYGLMGLLPETIYGKLEGEIYYRGESIIKNPALLRSRAGLILQNPSAQMLCRTVAEELAFGLENQRKQPAEIIKTIKKWSSRFEIEHLLARETSSLSGGEKQKTTLLSILMTEPEILMLDEPTAFLDPQSALEIMGIIQHMDTSKTLIFVEHNLQYLKPLIDRNLHLESKGKVIDRSRAEICWNPQLPVLRKQAVGKPLMNLSGIEFSFPSNFLLKGIDLELHEGEIISLTGRNGSGKTTLLEIMAGLRKPHQGKITIENHETVNDINRIRKLTGLLFQNPENHFIYNSVKEELQGNEIKYLQEEFAEKNEQSPFTLSEGEKRRLSIAIACLRNKQILLWDEPTFGQDLQNKLKLIKLADKLRQSGMGIVIVSHDTAFVQAVSDRIYKLKEGRLDG